MSKEKEKEIKENSLRIVKTWGGNYCVQEFKVDFLSAKFDWMDITECPLFNTEDKALDRIKWMGRLDDYYICE